MNKDQKAAVVDQVAAQIDGSEAILVVDYRGLSVPQAAELRRRLAEADTTLRVVKNTLTQRAADKAGAEDLKEHLEGPTAFAFVRGDAALAAKVIATFKREHNFPEFKGGRMDGAVVSVEQIQAIARLPVREVLQAQFVATVASPLTGLVRGLGALIQGLAMQLKQIGDQGLVTGEAPAPEPEEPPATEEPSKPEEAPDAEDPQAPEKPEAADEPPAVDEPSAVEEPSAAEEPQQEEPPGDEEANHEQPAEPAASQENPDRAQPAEPAASQEKEG